MIVLPGSDLRFRIANAPRDFYEREQYSALARQTLGGRAVGGRSYLAVMELGDRELFACPTAGALIGDDATPHEGTIMLPDGSFLTNVYRAVYRPEAYAAAECWAYDADIGEPISALRSSDGRGRSRRPAKWAGAALALAGVGAAVAKGLR